MIFIFFSSKVFLTLAVSGLFCLLFFLGSFCFFVSRDRLDFWLAGNGEIPGIVLCFFSFSFPFKGASCHHRNKNNARSPSYHTHLKMLFMSATIIAIGTAI